MCAAAPGLEETRGNSSREGARREVEARAATAWDIGCPLHPGTTPGREEPETAMVSDHCILARQVGVLVPVSWLSTPSPGKVLVKERMASLWV